MPLVKKHEENYENLSEEVFIECYNSMNTKRGTGTGGGSKKILDRRFVSVFGATARVCVRLWKLCLSSEDATFMKEDKASRATLKGLKSSSVVPYEPKHLLMALYFLRNYPNESQMAAQFGHDEKTIRKWVWIFVETIAHLKNDVVSL